MFNRNKQSNLIHVSDEEVTHREYVKFDMISGKLSKDKHNLIIIYKLISMNKGNQTNQTSLNQIFSVGKNPYKNVIRNKDVQ